MIQIEMYLICISFSLPIAITIRAIGILIFCCKDVVTINVMECWLICKLLFSNGSHRNGIFIELFGTIRCPVNRVILSCIHNGGIVYVFQHYVLLWYAYLTLLLKVLQKHKFHILRLALHGLFYVSEVNVLYNIWMLSILSSSTAKFKSF